MAMTIKYIEAVYFFMLLILSSEINMQWDGIYPGWGDSKISAIYELINVQMQN